MPRKRMVLLPTGQSVPQHRIDEVLTALHFLKGHGFDHLVGTVYELCRNGDSQRQTISHGAGRKLQEEGLIELDDGYVVLDSVTRAIILAAVTRQGLGRYEVVATAEKIIRH